MIRNHWLLLYLTPMLRFSPLHWQMLDTWGMCNETRQLSVFLLPKKLEALQKMVKGVKLFALWVTKIVKNEDINSSKSAPPVCQNYRVKRSDSSLLIYTFCTLQYSIMKGIWLLLSHFAALRFTQSPVNLFFFLYGLHLVLYDKLFMML